MSLTSSLYSGTSGLKNTGSALQVTSNNISNINTIGFKKGTATFADTLYQAIGTNSGSSQVGLGMNIDTVAQVFTDGSLETTANSTDLAIGGDGFFIVSEEGSDETFYTRAGNFSFDESGALATPSGFILQGWYVDANTGEEYGAIKDLVLSDYTCPPDNTEEMSLIFNLDADADSLANVLSNVFEYDEEEGTTVDSDSYEYQTVLTVYDSLGSSHEVTVYFDKLSDTDWEYIITCDPQEDNRNNVEALDSAGLLARGNITFAESSGEIVSMTMEEYTGQIGNVDISGNNTVDTVNFDIQDSEALSVDGYGFEMTFDGEQWVLSTASPATTSSWLDSEIYEDAEIIYSDENEIQLVLDPDSSGGIDEPDIIITLGEDAQDGDTLTFDVNNPLDCHIQDVEDIIYDNEAYNNTTMSINDPSVMTVDAEGLAIAWNPSTETWAWSNPEKAAADDTLISEFSTDTAAIDVNSIVVDYTNADVSEGSMVADVSLYYDNSSSEWVWSDELKDRDITVDTFTVEGVSSIDMVVQESSSLGAGILNGSYQLAWNGTDWDISPSSVGATVSCTVQNTTDEGCEVLIEDSSTGDSSTIEISFDDAMTDLTSTSQTIDFTILSTPPAEYDENMMKINTTGTGFEISFDAGSTFVDLDLGSPALTGGEHFTFTVDPDVAPEEYENAILTGDETYAAIDLDGSGADDGKDRDIVFTFDEELSSGRSTDPLDDSSTITFNISGSTAWREVTTDEAKDTGYLQFSVDFLGGEAGSTETEISFNIGTSWDGNNWINDSLSSTQYATSSSTIYMDADGYPSGDLEGVEVDSDGLLSGTYSNGQTLALFLIALADFNNYNGLDNAGDNLYAATNESGAAITNKPGENGLGTLSSYTLESSNVDISDEFVDMIELQNAYEANAKIISTVDEMMTTVIGMKR
ncbi:flagellar hook-basal body complex protein [uncultured Desulfobacter sp.]|uniref:flagellar hook-basal body complex protein n=1 Tax=uncultured Desulfobacter sp. TaxID=240139 RepID=UPI0029F4E1DB|nr:flagellar hook-basal body complex protein [uncultured Desulfobacter sp.]